jgi:hypothetical protein
MESRQIVAHGETVGSLKTGRPKLRQERQKKSSFRPPLRGLNGFTSLPKPAYSRFHRGLWPDAAPQLKWILKTRPNKRATGVGSSDVSGT